MCHTWQTSLRFDLETPATDAGWTAEQSRTNFEMITQLINTRSPETSYLLLKPLEGGLGHTGGTYWTSRNGPEYQAVLAWIKTLPADRYVPPPAPPVALSRVAGSGPRPAANARSSARALRSMPDIPKLPSWQRGSR